MNYYISDLHFFHENCLNFDVRPFNTLEEMHHDIITRWNATVHNDDHVYILGDMAWKEDDLSIQLISRLKGNLHLIKGNHDKVKDARYKRLFVEIVDYKEVQDKQQLVILSHYPIASWKNMRKNDWNGNTQSKYAIHLYGHVHNTLEYSIYKVYLKSLQDDYSINVEAYNVGCMLPYMNYIPRTLEEIIKGSDK